MGKSKSNRPWAVVRDERKYVSKRAKKAREFVILALGLLLCSIVLYLSFFVGAKAMASEVSRAPAGHYAPPETSEEKARNDALAAAEAPAPIEILANKNIPAAKRLEHLLALAKTVDSQADLLKLLAQKEPSYLRGVTAMFFSKSLQRATPANPRILIFGADAKLIITFNGDASERGFDELEILQFDDELEQFNFFELPFEKDRKARHEYVQKTKLVPDELEAKNLETVFERGQGIKNPESCTTCHTPNRKPIWESYALWPGALGQNDNILSRYVGAYNDKKAISYEAKWTNDFEHNMAKNPRYASLTKFRGDLQRMLSNMNQREESVKANDVFSSLIYPLNVRRMVRRLSANPGFASVVPLFDDYRFGEYNETFFEQLEQKGYVEELLKQDTPRLKQLMPSCLPKGLREKFNEETYFKVIRDTDARADQNYLALVDEMGMIENLYRPTPIKYEKPRSEGTNANPGITIGVFRYIFENLLDDSMAMESTAFQPLSYSFGSPDYPALAIQNALTARARKMGIPICGCE